MKIRLWKTNHSKELLSDVASAWKSGDLVIVCSPMKSDLSFVKHLPAAAEISLHGEWNSESQRELETRIDARAARNPVPYPGSPILGVFTSGTVAGAPRLVLYSKSAVEASLEAILKMFDREKITAIFCYPQPFHTFGLLLGYVLSVKLGVKLTTPNGKYDHDSHALREAASEPGLLTLGAPVHYTDLVRHFSESETRPKSTYSCIAGGAPVSVSLWHQMQSELKILQPSIGYGCTEASPGITHLPAGTAPRVDGEIGFPLQSLATVKIETDGVRIAGASLCTAIIDENGVSFPDELLIRDNLQIIDERWVYKGRMDLILNRGGVKFSLEQIERAIADGLGLQVIATGSFDERLGQELALTMRKSDFTSTAAGGINTVLERAFDLKLNSSKISLVSEFPVNESAKIDRAAIAARSEFKLPLSTTRLQAFLPHRTPMVWIDAVESFDDEVGECTTVLKADGLYMDGNYFNSSSAIELMAQSYGFLAAARAIANPQSSRTKLSKAFLISITNAEIEDCEGLVSGTRLHTRISGVRLVGPVTLLDGEVVTASGGRVAKASLKVYAE